MKSIIKQHKITNETKTTSMKWHQTSAYKLRSNRRHKYMQKQDKRNCINVNLSSVWKPVLTVGDKGLGINIWITKHTFYVCLCQRGFIYFFSLRKINKLIKIWNLPWASEPFTCLCPGVGPFPLTPLTNSYLLT